MPGPPSGAARHRWFAGALVALTGAAVLIWWTGESPFASLIGFTILTFAALVWLIVGPSWVLAGAPVRDAEVTATARRFGRRVMWLVVLSTVVIEAIWWVAAGAPNPRRRGNPAMIGTSLAPAPESLRAGSGPP